MLWSLFGWSWFRIFFQFSFLPPNVSSHNQSDTLVPPWTHYQQKRSWSCLTGPIERWWHGSSAIWLVGVESFGSFSVGVGSDFCHCQFSFYSPAVSASNPVWHCLHGPILPTEVLNQVSLLGIVFLIARYGFQIISICMTQLLILYHFTHWSGEMSTWGSFWAFLVFSILLVVVCITTKIFHKTSV